MQVLYNLVRRIYEADNLHAIFVIKDSEEMSDALTWLKANGLDSRELRALRSRDSVDLARLNSEGDNDFQSNNDS